MKNKKQILIYLFISVLCAAAIFGVFLINFAAPKEAEVPMQTSAEYNSAQTTKPPETCLLMLSDEVLCVYECQSSGNKLVNVISYIDVYSLESDVQSSLKDGIVFQNKQKLAEFIEDLSS